MRILKGVCYNLHMHLICAILQLEFAVALITLFNLVSETWSYG